MCGIAGIVSVSGSPVPAPAIKRMCDVIAHRGPDDAGYAFFGADSEGAGGQFEFVDPEFRHANQQLPVFDAEHCRNEPGGNNFSVALGHRRLSIIDLTHQGHQPMCDPDRKLWIAHNGEIYNFPQLRRQLESQGHVFRSGTDTEVILHLWRRHGRECLPMLDGMFAFALYDHTAGAITLARDRFGIKPLYYAVSQGYLIFASEIKAVLASGLVEARVDPAALVEYFTFQNSYGPQTLFAGVRMLGAGEYLSCGAGQDAAPSCRRYHERFPPAEPSLAESRDTAEMVAETFAAAVKRQLISDVEVGSYLSGGMDSGSIVSIAGRHIPRLLTFTCGFDLTNVDGIEQGFDERKHAEQLSFLLQTEHYDVVLHAGDMPAAMEKISWHVDDPRVGMCHQNWYAAKLASRFVKVCLGGAGGDELFAGYPWRYRRGMEAETFSQFDRAYLKYWHRLLEGDELDELFTGDLGAYGSAAGESFEAVMAGAPQQNDSLSKTENMLQRALYFEFKTFLHGLLVTEDRISMAHGLEARVPFLDNALADLAWRIPPSMKVNTESLGNRQASGHMDSADGKVILRRAMRQYLPERFTRQHKRGFSPPDENWYRGSSMDYIKTILLDRSALERPWFDQKTLQARLTEHFEGRRNHRLLIWSLLSFEWLQRHFIDRGVSQSPHD